MWAGMGFNERESECGLAWMSMSLPHLRKSEQITHTYTLVRGYTHTHAHTLTHTEGQMLSQRIEAAAAAWLHQKEEDTRV